MNFDQAFERLIGHEGGYVNHPAQLKYVNESKIKNHSRIQRGDVCCAGVKRFGADSIGGFFVRAANKLKAVRLWGCWLHSPGLRKGFVQRALHPKPKRRVNGVASAGPEARWRLRSMWRVDGREGWLGLVPSALSASSLRSPQGCRDSSIWSQVRALRRHLSQGRVRFPPPRRKGQLPKRNVLEQLLNRVGIGTLEVHSFVRELPSIGASR